jgi:mutator protein MutT
MNLQHGYHPLIPLRTAHFTLTALDKSQKSGLQADTLLFQVALTGQQSILGFAQAGSTLYYQSLSPSSPLSEMAELLNALLIFSFFVLNKSAVQLPSQPDNPLAEAWSTLELPGTVEQITGKLWVVLQRADFYQRYLITTMPLTLAVVALLLRADGAILLSHPPAHQRAISSWELPGGKVNSGESPAIALVRELQEELGITVSPASLRPLLFATDCFLQQSLLVHFYLVMDWDHEPMAQEQQTLAWVLPEQIHHYPMQVTHQVAFYQLAVLLGRYSLKWSQYAEWGPVERVM